MTIESITLKSYLKLNSDLELQFAPGINLIAGLNSSGKSTLLHYLDRSFVNQCSQVQASPNSQIIYLNSDRYLDGVDSQGFNAFSQLISQLNHKLTAQENLTVLIDDLELRLDPNRQGEIIPTLAGCFKDVQFICTTSSPIILSYVKADNIYVLRDRQVYRPSSSFGRSFEDILDQIFGVCERPKSIAEKLQMMFRLIESGEIEEATKIKEDLYQLIGIDDPSLVKAGTSIARKKILSEE